MRKLSSVIATAALLAATIAAGATPTPLAVPVRLLHLPLAELGGGGPIELRGVDGQATVALGLARDEVVTGAKLRLRLTYSPALMPELSHLRILLNGQTVVALPLPKEQAGREIAREVVLDPQYFTDYNHLRFDLIGHYTRECEDPQHSALWAAISDRSEIELEVRPLELRNDLALLPAPFFDPRDSRRLELPVVLPTSPSVNPSIVSGIRLTPRPPGFVSCWKAIRELSQDTSSLTPPQ